MGEHDKDIRNYGPCLRPYDWHGGGNGQGAHRSGSCALQYRKLLIQTGGRRHEREFTSCGREGGEVRRQSRSEAGLSTFYGGGDDHHADLEFDYGVLVLIACPTKTLKEIYGI
jgi:hypothetical protein